MVIVTSESRFQAVRHLLKLIQRRDHGNLLVQSEIDTLSSKLNLDTSQLRPETLEHECQRWNANQRALEAFRTSEAYHGVLFEGDQTSLKSLVLIGDAENIRKLEAELKLPVTGIRRLLFRNYSRKYLSLDCRKYFSLNRCLNIAVGLGAIGWVYDFMAEGAKITYNTFIAAARSGHLGLIQYLNERARADSPQPPPSFFEILNPERSPLATAIEMNHLAVIKYWVETSNMELPPLAWVQAQLRGDPSIIAYIDSQINPLSIPKFDLQDTRWASALIHYGRLDWIEQFFKSSWFEVTPTMLLNWAFKAGQAKVVAELIKHFKGPTFQCMVTAIRNGHLSLFQQYEAKFNFNYNQCLLLAATKGHFDAVLYFLSKGAIPSKRTVDETHACGYFDIAAYLQMFNPSRKLLNQMLYLY